MSSDHEDTDMPADEDSDMSSNEDSDIPTNEVSDLSTNEDYEVTADDLIDAAQRGLLDDVKALVTYHGLDLNVLDKENRWTALQVASFNGHLDVVRFLIESGADVNKRWETKVFNQWSAILFAAESGHRDVVEFLVSHGAGVNDTELNEGRSAIHLACGKNGSRELVEFLLANGATVDDRDQQGFNPLICACMYGRHEVVLTLLAHGAKVNYRADNNMTPLSAACNAGNNDIVMTLLARGGDVNDYDFPRVSPLYSASRGGSDEVVMTLLAHGAQVRDRDFSVWNPIHVACAGGHYKVVQILLSQGIEVGTHDCRGLTPLQNIFVGIWPSRFVPHLQMTNKTYTLKILLESGMDLGALNKEGLTTLEIVREHEWALYTFEKDCLTLLLDYGVGSGVLCRARHCGCNSTALMCWYLFFHLLSTASEQARESAQPLIGVFEKYFIKNSIVGLYPCNEEKAFEPARNELNWSKSRRAAYKAECEAEISRMKMDTIGNTCATYLSLLTRDVPALRQQNVLGQLTGDECVQRYPIYGNMIFSSYTRLRRVFLEEVSTGFFAILTPPLLPDCAEVVQRYLSVKDLANIVEVYHSYHRFLEKKLKLSTSPSR